MNLRSKYRTKQRETLLSYFKTVPGTHFTAGDVCEYLNSRGTPIGQSTIYRQLESLVDEGIINKYIIDGTSSACFEYVGAESHCDEHICFHCKCENCGKLIHLHCDEIEALQGHLYDEHRFRLDPRRTVFYGMCEECMINADKDREGKSGIEDDID